MKKSLQTICLQLLLSLGVPASISPSVAQQIWLPNKSDALGFSETDEDLIRMHRRVDLQCRNSSHSLETFFSCAKRDILTKTLEERGFCQSSECLPGQQQEWRPCGLPFSPQSKGSSLPHG